MIWTKIGALFEGKYNEHGVTALRRQCTK